MRKSVKIKVTAIVPSAGRGVRFKSKERKPFAKLNGKPLLSYVLKTLDASPLIKDIVLVTDKYSSEKARLLIKRYGVRKVRHIVGGGRTRLDSVKNGLEYVGSDSSFILIHDGVRPFLDKEIIKKTLNEALKFGASVSAVPVKATIKVAGRKNLVKYTPSRKSLWEVQTPQVFRKDLILKAYKKVKRGKLFTDDAALLESIGVKVKLVRGNYKNIKITTTEDMNIASALLKEK